MLITHLQSVIYIKINAKNNHFQDEAPTMGKEKRKV